MTTNAEKLSGVFLPVTTPFNRDMSVDAGALRANMEFYAQTEVRGYLALGSNGENRCLRESEKRQVLEIILAARSSQQVVMTGCIYDSTDQTIEFMKYVKDAGSDFATLLTPSYFRKHMTHDVLTSYFTECAEAVDIPVLLYNAPGFTGVTILPETVAILAAHPNIAGMKDSAPSGIENFMQYNSDSFSVLPGSASFFYPAILKGSPGGVMSLANAFPEAGIKLWKLARQGYSIEGEAWHDTMKNLNKNISSKYGVPGVKAAMDLAGLAGGYPRRPLQPLGETERDIIRQCLSIVGLLQ